MSPPALTKALRLWQYKDQYILEPLDEAASDCLVIKRSDGTLSFVEQPPNDKPLVQPTTVLGFLGIIDLLSGPYVVLMTHRTLIGSFRGADVFCISGTKILPCNDDLSQLTLRQKKDEQYYRKLLANAANASGLLVSYGADITVRTQQSVLQDPSNLNLPLWQQADPQFFWNRHLLQSTIAMKGTHAFALPVMQGSFQTFSVEVNRRQALITLVARRSIKRIGTRMWRRGADSQGAVANFVETEQIVEVGGTLASFVQVRGSIPIYWEQIVDLTYKPKMTPVGPEEETAAVAAKHLRQLSEAYGPVLILDLINQKGGEAKLGELYARVVQNLKDSRYVAFDFHKECGHLHFENLSLLHKDIADTLADQGYFMQTFDKQVARLQKGVTRTNCVDCLDRTNVTQSLLARRVLEEQLRRLKVFQEGDTIKLISAFERQYNVSWANHGDDISIQYSGTGALKGDFVRYGKRSNQGLLTDGRNSLLRYIFNNFADGQRQDGLDLITGGHEVSLYAASPFQEQGVGQYTSAKLAVCVLITSSALATYSLAQAGERPYFAVFALGWASLAAAIFIALKKYGREFCDRPYLCKLR